MTPHGIARLVTRLYAASGAREATDVDFEVYADALDDVDDEMGDQAGRDLCRVVDLVAHRPSPAMVRDQVQAILRRHPESRPALADPEDTGPPASRETTATWAAQARERLRGGPMRLAVSIGRVVQHIPTSAHHFGDHTLCPPGCTSDPDVPGPVSAAEPARVGRRTGAGRDRRGRRLGGR